MAVLKDSGDAAKGDQKGRKGGFKGKKLCKKHIGIYLVSQCL